MHEIYAVMSVVVRSNILERRSGNVLFMLIGRRGKRNFTLFFRSTTAAAIRITYNNIIFILYPTTRHRSYDNNIMYRSRQCTRIKRAIATNKVT